MKQLLLIVVLFLYGCGQYDSVETDKQLGGLTALKYGCIEWNVNGGHTIGVLGDSRMGFI